MASPERKISVVPPPAAEPPPSLEARLASLEDEAERLRAEMAALQDEIRWLTEEEAEWSGNPPAISHGWLARGWVRASLLLTAVGLVALVSVPYFLHLLDASARPADQAPVAAGSSVAITAAGAPSAPTVPATSRVAPREHVPAVIRGGAFEISDPARVLSQEPMPGRTGAAALSERGGPSAADRGSIPTAPVRGESP